MKPLVIAEAGVNHDGNLITAKRMVQIAAESNADFVKFQSFTPDLLTSRSAKLARYQAHNLGQQGSQYDMLSKLTFSNSEMSQLWDFAREVGVSPMSTAFDAENVEPLYRLGQRTFKIPSGEILNVKLIESVCDVADTIYISSGMCGLGDIEQCLWRITNSGFDLKNIVLMHCVTNYPALPSELNLSCLPTLKKCFGVPIGYSDHSIGLLASIVAVSLGAEVIEKHFSLDISNIGPDHAASLPSDQLAEFVDLVKSVPTLLGLEQKIPTVAELENAKVARRSIVAKRLIEAGELLDETNITCKRPGTGLSPLLWDLVVGTAAIRRFDKDELISLKQQKS